MESADIKSKEGRQNLRSGTVGTEEKKVESAPRHGRRIIVVTGATGTVGRACIKELLLRGGDNVQIRAAVHNAKTAKQRLPSHERVSVAEFDYNNEDTYDNVLNGVWGLFLLTGYTIEMNHQTKIMVDKALKAGCEFIVHNGVFAPPIRDTTVTVACWHQLVEQYISASGVGYCLLQPNMFMSNVIEYGGVRADPGTLNSFFVGDSLVSWVDPDDIGAVAANILLNPEEHNGKSYSLCVEAATCSDVAKLMQTKFGKTYKVLKRSPDEFLRAVLAAGQEPHYMNGVKKWYEMLLKGKDTPHQVNDNVDRLLGRAGTSWSQFIDKHAHEMKY